MKKTLLMLLVTLFAVTAGMAQDKPYTVVFYNLENLFDIYDDPETYDEEVLEVVEYYSVWLVLSHTRCYGEQRY